MYVTSCLLQDLKDCIFIIESHFFNLCKLSYVFFPWWSGISWGHSTSGHTTSHTSTCILSHHHLHHSWVHHEWLLTLHSSSWWHTCSWHSSSRWHTCSRHTWLSWHTTLIHHTHGVLQCLWIHHLSHHFWVVEHGTQLWIGLSHLFKHRVT